MREKILVTGASGCAGSYQIRNLLDNHGTRYEIHATKRARSSLDLIDAHHRRLVSFYDCDLTDSFAVAGLLSRLEPSVILHYAGDTFIPPSSENTELYITSNPRMVLNIFNAIRLIKKYRKDYDPVVLIPSSLEVYGPQFACEREYLEYARSRGAVLAPPLYNGDEFVSEIPISEENLLRPRSPYAIGKCVIEDVVRLNSSEYGTKTVLLRCCNQTGPGRLPNFAETSFARQISQIIKGRMPPLVKHGNLQPVRDFLDYRDAVKAHFMLVELVADRKIRLDSPINIGSGKSHAIGEILDYYLAKALERGFKIRTEIDTEKLRRLDISTIVADNSRLKELTGWKPEIPFQQTLDDILEYWLNHSERTPLIRREEVHSISL